MVVSAGCDYLSHAEIEESAVNFARKRSGRLPRAVECMRKDADLNGYVTCTVFEDDGRMYPLECSHTRSNAGCKVKGLVYAP